MTSATAITGPGTASIGAAALTEAAGSLASKGARAVGARPSTPARAARRSAAARPAPPARTGTTAKTSTTSKTTSTAKSTTGYATVKLPAEFAFLNDPKVSIEEKLSRFIGLMMARSERRLQEQMEKMAAGAGSSDGTSSTSKTSASSSKSGFSLWGFAKSILPPLGLAASVVGDATLKSLINQVSGPVLAAAATAVGLPELAPAALKLGPQLAKLVTSDTGTALASLTGSAASAAATSTGTSSGSTGASGSTTAKVTASDGSTSEKAQLLELQRLQDQDKELFSLFSNMLKSMHDARMTAVQNIR